MANRSYDQDRRDMRYAYRRYSGEDDWDRHWGRSHDDYRRWRERPGRYNSGYGLDDRPYRPRREEGGGYEAGYGEGDRRYDADNAYPGRWADQRDREGRYSGMGASGQDVERATRDFRGVGPKGYTRSDQRIREQVCDVLMDDPLLDASDIEVTVKDGEITLSGKVSEREWKRRAEDLAERCSLGKHVQNNIRVGEG